MKKTITLVIILATICTLVKAQTSCQNALPFCAGGQSGVTFPATTSVTAGQTGPNYGCLGSTPNPAWYYLQIGNSGTLDILIQGMITSPPGPGQDVDFICWGPFNTLAGICNSLTAGNIVDCSYSSSFTETLNIPAGVTGQYYMVLITNFANIQQNIIFNQFGGTGNTDCSLLSSNTQICMGSSATVTITPPQSLTNLTYSMNPGALTSQTPTFVVTPTVTTSYTVFATGQNNLGATLTQTASSNVTVNPQPSAAPTLTQTTCTSTVNAYNLGLAFNPPTPAPSYSINWATLPNGIPSATVNSYTGAIAPGLYEATVTAAGGCTAAISFSINDIPESAAFTLSPMGHNHVITCAQPSITINAVNANDTFTWTNGIIAPVNGSVATFDHTGAGTWTVYATNINSGCVDQQTIAISINTIAPQSSLSPSFQSITCSLTSVITVTANASPTVNITHQVMSPQGGSFVTNASQAIYQPGGPGTYTHVLINDVNGCKTVKEFTVYSSQVFPTYSVVSPQNYTLGCSTKSTAVISITSASVQGGGAISYTLIPPNTSSVTPPGPLSGISTYTVNAPGTYTTVAKDNVNLCETRVAVTITSHTFGPTLDTLLIPRTVLDCFVPKTRLKAISSNTNATYNWSFPGVPGNQAGDSITLFANFSARTSTVIDNHTLTLTDQNNKCITTTVVTIYQNLFLPKAVISNGGVAMLNCFTPTIMLSNMSSTGIQGSYFPSTGPVSGYLWEGPSPQLPKQISSNYVAETVGVYTLTAMDMNNGCTSKTTTTIGDDRIYPIVNKPNAPPPFILDCGPGTATITLNITTVTTGLVYTWIGPAESHTSSGGPGKLITDAPGYYKVIATNTVNGCASSGEATVVNGVLTATFEAGQVTGYAPLTVTFSNTSASSSTASASSSITSIWSFGNGTSSVTASAGVPVTAVYNQPGTYTVILTSQKGTCLDSARKVITVEMPSDLTVPNVFTPNGDHVNDVFFLKTTNIKSISFQVFDRWGHKVYDLESDTGNISWDGKNQAGVEVSEGTYFYLLKAKGTDDKPYESKGNISLFR